jgi:glutaredoxin
MKAILYTAPGCPFCVIVKNFLVSNKVSVKEIDVSKNAKLREQMVKKSGQENVPVTEIDGMVIVGYDLKKLKEALKVK